MFLDASPRLALGGPAHGGSAVVYRLITSLLFAMRRGGSGVGDLGDRQGSLIQSPKASRQGATGEAELQTCRPGVNEHAVESSTAGGYDWTRNRIR